MPFTNKGIDQCVVEETGAEISCRVALAEPIRVRLPEGEKLTSRRILMSAGVCSAFDDGYPGAPYARDAIVPRWPWKQLGTSDMRLLGSDEPVGLNGAFQIIKVPKDLVDRFHSLGTVTATSEAQVGRCLTGRRAVSAIRALAEFGRSMGEHDDRFTVQGVAVRNIGMATTTVNKQLGERIGLHIDSWDRMPIGQRASSRNRLNINLGLGSRFIMFIATPIMQILSTPTSFEGDSPTDGLRRWLARYPQTSVYSLRVLPGEAYVGPTEVVPHDSTTYGKTSLDISLTMLGYFRPR